MRKIVIASDSFKGSLSSLEVAHATETGIKSVYPECETICLETADGGEGTASALTRALAGLWVKADVSDPLGRKTEAGYGIAQTCGIKTAIMEMAQASGLTLLKPSERNPLLTSTYGTGEMILDALDKGCRRFLIGIGGSATNDGGTGMLEALGFRFNDIEGNPVTGLCGGKIHTIAGIDTSMAADGLKESEFIIACDVQTPFCGPEGAAAVFGPQKGGTPGTVALLEEGMQHLNKLIIRNFGTDLSKTEGAGAAGGLGGAFKVFLKAELNKGIDMVLDAIGFDHIIEGADLVITGEGKTDSQTSRGKVISGVTERAARQGIPVIAISGIVDMDADQMKECGLEAVYPIGPRPQNESDLEYAMRPEVASSNISKTVASVLKSHRIQAKQAATARAAEDSGHPVP